MELLKKRRTIEELKDYLKDKTDDYILEQYCYTRIAFEEDVRKGRYNGYAEHVRAMLKLTILKRMAGLEKGIK